MNPSATAQSPGMNHQGVWSPGRSIWPVWPVDSRGKAMSGSTPARPVGTVASSAASSTPVMRASYEASTNQLGNLDRLTALDLRYNEITTVPDIGDLAGLQSLDLYGNPLSDVSALAGRRERRAGQQKQQSRRLGTGSQRHGIMGIINSVLVVKRKAIYGPAIHL